MENPRINVTPLIDVLLVLLIIFMVISPMKPSIFKTRIPDEPKNDDLNSTPDPQTLVVSITPESNLEINHEVGLGSVDEPGPMIERLKHIFDQRRTVRDSTTDTKPRTAVFIKAPRGIDYGSVARVVDAVKSSGADPIALQLDDLH